MAIVIRPTGNDHTNEAPPQAGKGTTGQVSDDRRERASYVGAGVTGGGTARTERKRKRIGQNVEEFERVKYLNFVDFPPLDGSGGDICVKGRLKAHVGYWRYINANKEVLHVVEHGYSIPFYTIPLGVHLTNNKSSLDHADFVQGEILGLLNTGRIREVSNKPYVINPLSVSVEDDKKRLILDCVIILF